MTTRANSYNDITGLQGMSIRCAAVRVGCTAAEMAGFFIAGGEWECKPGAELEELLVECWGDQAREGSVNA